MPKTTKPEAERVDVRTRPVKGALKNADQATSAPQPRSDEENAFADFCRLTATILKNGPAVMLGNVKARSVLPNWFLRTNDAETVVGCIMALAEMRRLLKTRGICQKAQTLLLLSATSLLEELEGCVQ